MDELILLQTVVEESPIAMALFTGEGLIIHFSNKVMLNIWKKDKSVVGQPFKNVTPDFYNAQLLSEIDNVYQTGNIYEATTKRFDISIDSIIEVCYFSLILKPLKNAGGKTWGILHTAKDVTAQVKLMQESKALDEIHESDNHFRSLIEHAPVAIGLFRGLDMVIESANNSLLDLWGKDSTIIGLPILQALPEIKNTKYIDILREVKATGKPYYGYEMQSLLYKQKYNREAYFNYIYKPVFEADGSINQVMAIANNVTEQVLINRELEASERRFKSLILEAPVAVAVYMGKNMVIEVANEAMIAFWGKGNTVIGQPLAQALPELEGQPFFQLLDDVFTSGITYHSNESRADLLIDGQMRSSYFNFTYKPLFDASDNVYGIINMAIDVTDQVQARVALEEVARKKDEFLSVASHEMKTPLTSLKASMQLITKMLKSDLSSAVIPVFMHKANSSLVKILRLIDDLMHVTKVQEGQLPLNKSWFRIFDLVKDCCDLVRTEHNIELILKGNKKVTVYADAARIDQVVVNFVNNAIKYAPGSKKIILEIEQVENAVKVSVHDFGIGIPTEKQAYLFDRYFRVDYSGIQFSGLGLGLYISAEIIKRHSGTIGVTSELGSGSTFWFTLPV